MDTIMRLHIFGNTEKHKMFNLLMFFLEEMVACTINVHPLLLSNNLARLYHSCLQTALQKRRLNSSHIMDWQKVLRVSGLSCILVLDISFLSCGSLLICRAQNSWKFSVFLVVRLSCFSPCFLIVNSYFFSFIPSIENYIKKIPWNVSIVL